MRETFFEAAKIFLEEPERVNQLANGMLGQSVFDGMVDENFSEDVSKTSVGWFIKKNFSFPILDFFIVNNIEKYSHTKKNQLKMLGPIEGVGPQTPILF